MSTNKKTTLSFMAFPENLDQLKSLEESSLDSPYKTAALTLLSLANYDKDSEETLRMLNFLKGPQPLSNYEIQFLRDRLRDKAYLIPSFFIGSSPDNNYKPDSPYQLEIYEDPYSYLEEGYAKLLLKSSGADSPRPIKLRKKGEEWFLWEILFLSDIRKPREEEPWA